MTTPEVWSWGPVSVAAGAAVAQALFLLAAFGFGFYQLWLAQTDEKRRYAIKECRDFSEVQNEILVGGFEVSPAFELSQYNNYCALKSALSKAGKVEQPQVSAIKIFNHLARIADLLDAKLIDETIIMTQLDAAILGLYVAMEPSFKLMEMQLGAEIPAVLGLARRAQANYVRRGGADGDLAKYVLGREKWPLPP